MEWDAQRGLRASPFRGSPFVRSCPHGQSPLGRGYGGFWWGPKTKNERSEWGSVTHTKSVRAALLPEMVNEWSEVRSSLPPGAQNNCVRMKGLK